MKWKGLGFFAVFVNLSMSTYYNLILAYSLYFLFKSFSFPLPWALDDIETRAEPWNKVKKIIDFLIKLGEYLFRSILCIVNYEYIFFYITFTDSRNIFMKIS